MKALRHFLLALQFFTRIPVTGRLADWVGFSQTMLRASAAYFPAVGVVVDDVFIGTNTGQLLDAFDLESIEILRGLRPKFEEHHGIKYSNSALSSAAELSAAATLTVSGTVMDYEQYPVIGRNPPKVTV